MRLRRWIGVALLTIGASGIASMGSRPITLGSGAVTIPLGADAFAHDFYLTFPAALPFTAVLVVGLLLLVLPGNGRDGA